MMTFLNLIRTYSTDILRNSDNLNYIIACIVFVLMLLGCLPTYFTNRHIEHQENYIHELMSSIEVELLSRELN